MTLSLLSCLRTQWEINYSKWLHAYFKRMSAMVLDVVVLPAQHMDYLCLFILPFPKKGLQLV